MTRVRLHVAHAAFAAAMALVAGSCATGTETTARELLDRTGGTSYATIPPATTSTTISVPASATTAPPIGGISPVEQEYLVKAGDSLSKVAGIFDLTIQQLIEYNQFSHTGHVLHPGDIVRVPPGGKVRFSVSTVRPSTVVNPQNASTNTATPSTGCTHTISSGENPSKVAAEYAITFDILQAANPNRDFNTWFLVGAAIQIPPGADCP
jgi:peptidoglycan endopeptidase LytF